MLRLTMKSAWTQLDFNQISHDTHNIYISNKKEIILSEKNPKFSYQLQNYSYKSTKYVFPGDKGSNIKEKYQIILTCNIILKKIIRASYSGTVYTFTCLETLRQQRDVLMTQNTQVSTGLKGLFSI